MPKLVSTATTTTTTATTTTTTSTAAAASASVTATTATALKRLRGLVVTVPDLKSGDPEFKSRSDH